MKTFNDSIVRALTTPWRSRFALAVLIYPALERKAAVKKFRHRFYMKTWRPGHLESVNATWRRWSHARPGKHSQKVKFLNRKSHPSFGTRRRWLVEEDALLFSGQTESQLVQALGRTIRSIQRRKHALRQKEVA